MKAERKQVKVEFVPVVITLESQEEVDSLYAIGNHCCIGYTLPALDRWYRQLEPFSTPNRNELWNKLNKIVN